MPKWTGEKSMRAKSHTKKYRHVRNAQRGRNVHIINTIQIEQVRNIYVHIHIHIHTYTYIYIYKHGIIVFEKRAQEFER